MATDTKPRTPGRAGPTGAPGSTGTAGSTGTPGSTGTAGKARPARPGRPARPIGSPRHTRPVVPGPVRPSGAPATQTQPATAPAARGPEEPRQQRMPFILLLVGLLGGALVSLLVISTTLDAGAYRINNLTQQNEAYTKDIQLLTNQVQTERNPATIYREAYQFGMRRDPNMRFVNPQAGTISSVTPASR